MIRYVAAGAAFKLLSATGPGRRLYRRIGNSAGARRRARVGLPAPYLARARQLLHDAHRHELLRDGSRVLEIGTGWVHWEATVAALFYDVDAVVVDVCDNRQLAAWRAYVRDLVAHLDALTPDATRADRARRRIERLRDARTWSEVYALLRLTYDPHPSGTLGRLHGREFDLVVSSNVLQHVRREVLDELPGDIAALLAPGGHALHRVDLADQLAHFDPRAPRKNYLRFSARAWRWIDSPLQHVNRLQLSEWLELFEGAGLERVEVSVATTDLGGLRPHREFARFPRAELECLDARLLHRRGCETGYDPPPALGGSGAAVGGAKRVSRIAT